MTLVERLGHDTVLYVRVRDAGLLTVSLNGQHHQAVGTRFICVRATVFLIVSMRKGFR